MEFRKALGSSAQISQAISHLRDLEGMCRALLFVVAKDVHMNRKYDLENSFDVFPGVVIRESDSSSKVKGMKFAPKEAVDFNLWLNSYVGGMNILLIIL